MFKLTLLSFYLLFSEHTILKPSPYQTKDIKLESDVSYGITVENSISNHKKIAPQELTVGDIVIRLVNQKTEFRVYRGNNRFEIPGDTVTSKQLRHFIKNGPEYDDLLYHWKDGNWAHNLSQSVQPVSQIQYNLQPAFGGCKT